MKVTVLPKDLYVGESKDLQLYNYKRTDNINKTKINLSRHTISFLRTGTKEVIGDEEVLRFLEKYNQFASKLKHQKSFYIFEYDKYIQNFVIGLEQILELPKDIQAKILKSKFEEIMLYLVHQNSPDFLNSLVQNVDDRISRLTNIVENNKHNKLSLEELAFLCNMSISTFKREFSKLYQNTPMKWFNEQRLNHIAFLLRTKRSRPIELYEEAGYENLSNFVQAFKKQFGMTPKQYQTQA